MIVNYAHRGASESYPENTMLAFSKAIEMGCTGIETDVQRTKDGVLVLIHDEYLDRTTDGVGLVCEKKYEELTSLDAGSFKDRRFSTCRIPTLRSFLQFVKNKNITVNLEIKNSIVKYKDIEIEILYEVFRAGLEDNVIISSFNHSSIFKIKAVCPRIKVGALCPVMSNNLNSYISPYRVNYIHPSYNFLTKENIEECKSKNIGINVYTVNDKDDLKKFVELDVDGIITNKPELLCKILKDKKGDNI